MPAADADLRDDSPSPSPAPLTRLPFPPITRSHILNCSVHNWYPRYRRLTPKSRLIPLTSSFVFYLREDGIVLPPEPSSLSPQPQPNDSSTQTAQDSDSDSEWDSGPEPDPSASWPTVHSAIQSTIAELGGRVHPKLNWSAPKDATWIAATNSMECSFPNDIYLLLKSSDFVTHDLEQAFDGCDDADSSAPEFEPSQNGNTTTAQSPGSEPQRQEKCDDDIPYHLLLRKTIPGLLTSMEFRCFVRNRRLLAISQRELKHYDFLPSLVPVLQDLIYDFFEEELRTTFPDPSFVFDVYVPDPQEAGGGRVWLIDVNPWAPRTDPLLFSWLEVLTIPDLPEETVGGVEGGFVRLSLGSKGGAQVPTFANGNDGPYETDIGMGESEEGDEDEIPSYLPEIRLVKRDDPENYSFDTQLYSAHKLPQDVVDAGMQGQGGIRDFLERVRRRERDPAYSSDED